MAKVTRTPGGTDVFRHEEQAPPDEDVAHADDERISAHLERMHDGKHEVLHEIVSDRVHLDVHVLFPSEAHPFFLLATAGMSARAMAVPPGLENAASWAHAELCILLPPSWPMRHEAFADERNYWPIRLLKGLARLPHDYGTWLGWGHSIPNGDPAEPYAPGTALAGAWIIPPYGFGREGFEVLGSPPLHLFQVLPVTAAEMRLKLDVGIDDALARLEDRVRDLFGPIDPGRPSAL